MFGELLLREKSYQPKILLLFIEGAVSASQRNTYVETGLKSSKGNYTEKKAFRSPLFLIFMMHN